MLSIRMIGTDEIEWYPERVFKIGENLYEISDKEFTDSGGTAGKLSIGRKDRVL